VTTPDPAPASEVLCSPWATRGDIPPEVLAELLQGGASDEDIDQALLLASEILWALSGRTWMGGGCEETATLRSYPPQPGQGTWPYHRSWPSCACWRWGTWLDGRLYPAAAFFGVHIDAPIALQLPRSPVTAVTSVTIDGSPFVAWRLLRAGWLERTDGQGWRMCDDSTTIVYEFGEPPPAGGVAAAVELAVEIVRDRFDIGECRLPRRTTSVTRQGISMELLDPMEMLDGGRTGLYAVDLWLTAVNPSARPQAAGVWSPDVPSTMRL
jgi:hypothetical protein